MRTFAGGEVFPGVTALPIPGHTPGHTGYLIESGGQRVFIWGDVVHMPEVQVPRPEVSMVVDTDPTMAADTRRRVFDMVASEGLLVTGMHLHFPGFARVLRDGSGYRLVPEAWQQSI
jgi:glyoxylase-like metal-dependent hydrolase (beta-lactamase superfamily II)